MNYRRNLEGFKNPEDIHDNPSMEEIRRELEEFDQFRDCIDPHFEVEALNLEKKELYKRFEKDAIECIKSWKERIERLLKEEDRISDRIDEYLREKGLLLPRFDVYIGQQALDVQRKYHLLNDAELEEEPMIIVFNLPKPLFRFWWKGGAGTWGERSQDTRQMVIEWGRIYRDVIRTVWDMTDYGDTCFERLNPEGVHEEGEYYYLWRLRED
jgi:uncharacterized protein (UPF0335 family)